MASKTPHPDFQTVWGFHLGREHPCSDDYLDDSDDDEYVISDDFSFSEESWSDYSFHCSSLLDCKKPLPPLPKKARTTPQPVRPLPPYIVEYYHRVSPEDYHVNRVEVFPYSDGSIHQVDLGVVSRKAFGCRTANN